MAVAGVFVEGDAFAIEHVHHLFVDALGDDVAVDLNGADLAHVMGRHVRIMSVGGHILGVCASPLPESDCGLV